MKHPQSPLNVSGIPYNWNLTKKGSLMRKPRMTKTERDFTRLISQFVFVENGGRLIESPKWKMLNKQTQDTFLTLIATKTRWP